MSRYVRTSDLNNAIMSKKPELGILAEPIATIFERIVQTAPTANVRENVYGEWVIKDKKIFCTKCNKPQFKYTEINIDWRPSFCPHCGANMRNATTTSNTKDGWDGEYYLEDC